MQSKYVLWVGNSLEMIKGKKPPSACAMVWIVASDKGIHSRSFVTQAHALRQEFAGCRIHALMHNVQPASCPPSSSTKKRLRQEIPCIGTSCQPRLPKGKLASTLTTVHRTSASATENVRDEGQRIFLARALLSVPVRKLHSTRWLCTTSNDRTLISWRLLRTSTVLFVLVTSGGIVIREVSLDPTTNKVAT